jgi:hypothetical protein
MPAYVPLAEQVLRVHSAIASRFSLHESKLSITFYKQRDIEISTPIDPQK